MVVRIDTENKVYVDEKEYQPNDINSTFLNELFVSLLKKESTIVFDDEAKAKNLGELFLAIRDETSENSEFYNTYMEYKKINDEINSEIKSTEESN